MVEILSNEQYWSRDQLVRAHSDLPGALDYEIDAVRDAADRARSSGPVRSVHVLGVGTGRELADIRAATRPTRLFGWDLSQPMVDGCRSQIERHGWPDVTVELASIDDVPDLIDEPADVVIGLSAVLCYIPDDSGRRRTARAMRSMCRTGAGLALVVQQRAGRRPWVPYFAAIDSLERAHLRHEGIGNRRSRYGDVAVLLHHYGRREIGDLLGTAGFERCNVRSLREWAADHDRAVPRRSPNPLIVTATAC